MPEIKKVDRSSFEKEREEEVLMKALRTTSPLKFVEKEVKVSFEGVVKVRMPSPVPKGDLLAKNIVLSRIVAKEEQDDPSAEAFAFIEYCEEVGIDEGNCGIIWDKVKIKSIDGRWEAGDD